jgi:hypothetical protein
MVPVKSPSPPISGFPPLPAKLSPVCRCVLATRARPAGLRAGHDGLRDSCPFVPTKGHEDSSLGDTVDTHVNSVFTTLHVVSTQDDHRRVQAVLEYLRRDL